MAEQMTLTSIIGLIIGVILTIAVIFAGASFMNLLSPSADEASVNNFNALSSKIKSMMESPGDFQCNLAGKGAHPFYLMDGVILVGYNYDQEKQHTDCSNEFATKPSKYYGQAVICLHEENYVDNFDDDSDTPPPIQCYPFDEKIIFLTPHDNLYYGGFGGSISKKTHPLEGGNYEDLFLYGSECDQIDPDLGTTKLYLEVYKKDDEVYVYMSEHNPDNTNQVLKNKERCETLPKKVLLKT